MKIYVCALIGILLINSTNAESFIYLQGVKDNFSTANSDEVASISYDFNDYFIQTYSTSPAYTFDSYEANKPRAVSFVFSEITDEIVEAEVRLKARPLDDSKAEGNDRILLGLVDEITFKQIALGIDGGANPYFNFDWQIDDPTVPPPTPPELGFDIMINLDSFNTTDTQNFSILDDINTFKSLDIAITDDSAWDYVELHITTIPEPTTVGLVALTSIGLSLYRDKRRKLCTVHIRPIAISNRYNFNSLRWSTTSHSTVTGIKRIRQRWRL